MLKNKQSIKINYLKLNISQSLDFQRNLEITTKTILLNTDHGETS